MATKKGTKINQNSRVQKSTTVNFYIASLIPYLLLNVVLANTQNADTRDYCSSDNFDVSCADGEAILMKTALFGRMNPGKCISAEYAHAMGCYADVLAHMDSSCSGRRQCTVAVGMMDQVAQPCPKDFKAYLEASHTCVTVARPPTDDCRSHKVSISSIDGGFINRESITDDRGRLLSECSWQIEVNRGQIIALSMSTYSSLVIRNNGGKMNENDDLLEDGVPDMIDICSWFLMITDGERTVEIDLCDGSTRDRKLYESHTNKITLSFYGAGSASAVPNFLLKYDARGCPDIMPPSGSWTRRDADNAMIRCNDTGETWYLTCRKNEWVGDIGNCTSKVTPIQQKVKGGSGFLQEAGIVFAVFVGLILGLFIGTGLLAVAFCCRRRMRRQNNSSTNSSQCVTALSSETSHRPSYPGLLTQEKPIGGNICEYTHVWEVRAQPCTGTLPGTTASSKKDNTFLAALDTADLQNQSCTIYEPSTFRNNEGRLPCVRGDGTVFYDIDQSCPHTCNQ